MEAKDITTLELMVGAATRDRGFTLDADLDHHEQVRQLLAEAVYDELVLIDPNEPVAQALLGGTSYPKWNNAKVPCVQGFWPRLHDVVSQAADPTSNRREAVLGVLTLQERLRGGGIEISLDEIHQRLSTTGPSMFSTIWTATLGDHDVYVFRR